MKKSELQEIIRLVVREEIEKSLPQYLMEVLAEKITTTQPVITERAAPTPAAPTLTPAQLAAKRKALVGYDTPIKQAPVKAPKVFSSNPLLNQVLNETSGGVPTEEEAAMMTPSVLDKAATLPPEVLQENTGVAAVVNALNKDYSSLLKAADEKAKRNRP